MLSAEEVGSWMGRPTSAATAAFDTSQSCAAKRLCDGQLGPASRPGAHVTGGCDDGCGRRMVKQGRTKQNMKSVFVPLREIEPFHFHRGQIYLMTWPRFFD
jgi:hypothetical protein